MAETDEDRSALARYAEALADGVEAALPTWVERSVERILDAWGQPVDGVERRAAIDAAGLAARDDVGPAVRALVRLDIDAQRANPLAIVRTAVRYPTAVLESFGVPPIVRDATTTSQFPDDPYDLTPMSFGELDPNLHEIGLTWGAAKAHVHLARHRRS